MILLHAGMTLYHLMRVMVGKVMIQSSWMYLKRNEYCEVVAWLYGWSLLLLVKERRDVVITCNRSRVPQWIVVLGVHS